MVLTFYARGGERASTTDEVDCRLAEVETKEGTIGVMSGREKKRVVRERRYVSAREGEKEWGEEIEALRGSVHERLRSDAGPLGKAIWRAFGGEVDRETREELEIREGVLRKAARKAKFAEAKRYLRDRICECQLGRADRRRRFERARRLIEERIKVLYDRQVKKREERDGQLEVHLQEMRARWEAVMGRCLERGTSFYEAEVVCWVETEEMRWMVAEEMEERFKTFETEHWDELVEIEDRAEWRRERSMAVESVLRTRVTKEEIRENIDVSVRLEDEGDKQRRGTGVKWKALNSESGMTSRLRWMTRGGWHWEREQSRKRGRRVSKTGEDARRKERMKVKWWEFPSPGPPEEKYQRVVVSDW